MCWGLIARTDSGAEETQTRTFRPTCPLPNFGHSFTRFVPTWTNLITSDLWVGELPLFRLATGKAATLGADRSGSLLQLRHSGSITGSKSAVRKAPILRCFRGQDRPGRFRPKNRNSCLHHGCGATLRGSALNGLRRIFGEVASAIKLETRPQFNWRGTPRASRHYALNRHRDRAILFRTPGTIPLHIHKG